MTPLPISLEGMEPDDTPPSDGEILAVLVGWYDADPSTVLQWLGDFKPQAAFAEYLQELGVCTKT